MISFSLLLRWKWEITRSRPPSARVFLYSMSQNVMWGRKLSEDLAWLLGQGPWPSCPPSPWHSLSSSIPFSLHSRGRFSSVQQSLSPVQTLCWALGRLEGEQHNCLSHQGRNLSSSPASLLIPLSVSCKPPLPLLSSQSACQSPMLQGPAWKRLPLPALPW